MHLINGHRIEFYESIEDLPMIRFQKYSKYVLVESGVGSSYQDSLKKIARVQGYIKTKDYESANADLQNLALNFQLIFNETNLKSFAFACLIKSIDGKMVLDVSEQGLQKTLDKLKHAKTKLVFQLFDNLKKKLTKS